VRANRIIEALGVDRAGPDADVLLRWPLAAEHLPAGVQARADAVVAALARAEGESVAAHGTRLRDGLVPLVADANDNAEARVADLDVLVAAAQGAACLSDVAADLTLEPPSSTSDLAGPPVIDEDWLVISTIHSAKGLEWDVVHLLNAADGNIPSDMALGSAEGLEEERRLFYVAVTRPRRALHVYVPLRFHHRPRGRDDDHTYGQPSRFLSARVTACVDTLTVTREREPLPTIDAPAAIEMELDALWS
jgi:DNA helicase-2/ATP-dependent DNA helicase PcrA